MTASRIESVRIRGFRSLADVELSNLRNANVLIGANGSGKSNFIRFFEMMSWMLRSRRLEEFVALRGGADDQLHKGARVTPRMEAELALHTEAGRSDYRFALAHAHPDRFVFTEEAFRFSGTGFPTAARWTKASCRAKCGRRTSSGGARDPSRRVGGRTDRRGVRQAGSRRSLAGQTCRVDADTAWPGSRQVRPKGLVSYASWDRRESPGVDG